MKNLETYEKELDFFVDCVQTLAQEVNIKQMDEFVQHGDTPCLNHVISVAYLSYRFAINRHMKLDYKSLIRGAILHDYFLYDWRTEKNGFRHGFIHPRIAMEKAMKETTLNDIEKNIILRHMFPLTVVPPRYREAYIVCMMDKICAVSELLDRSYIEKVLPRLNLA